VSLFFFFYFSGRSLDVFPHLHPELPGWTEDETVNKMLAAKPGKHHIVRFDRIVMNGTFGYQPASIRILGTAPIAYAKDAAEGEDAQLGEAPVFISDHFGLIARFKKQIK
jgi:hypothetical protein